MTGSATAEDETRENLVEELKFLIWSVFSSTLRMNELTTRQLQHGTQHFRSVMPIFSTAINQIFSSIDSRQPPPPPPTDHSESVPTDTGSEDVQRPFHLYYGNLILPLVGAESQVPPETPGPRLTDSTRPSPPPPAETNETEPGDIAPEDVQRAIDILVTNTPPVPIPESQASSAAPESPAHNETAESS